jgi:hypothetical protein
MSSEETQRTLAEIRRRTIPLPPRLHRNLNYDIFEDDLIEIEITMTYFGYLSNPDTVTARVLHVDWDSPDDATITATIIRNHHDLEVLGTDMTLEDLVVEVFVCIGAPFDVELMLPEHFADALFTIMRQRRKKRPTRRTVVRDIFEEACLDHEIAARVCHTGDGIRTRSKFYPLK